MKSSGLEEESIKDVRNIFRLKRMKEKKQMILQLKI